MTDRVDYELPFGPLGQLARWLFVRRQVEGIFDYRNEVIVREFGSARA
jgi:ligand-binding SRPBCC domain-containing protein